MTRLVTAAGILAALGVVLAVGLLASGCHARPQLSPVANIADYGQKAIATVNQIAKVTAALPITDAQKAPIMIGANLLQQAGGKLADALDAYRLATAANKAQAAAKVNAILDEIDKIILKSLKLPPDTTYGQVVNLLGDLAGFLSHIRFSLGLPVAWRFATIGGVA